jgi:hypothetical protein
MREKRFMLLCVAVILLTACTATKSTPPVIVTEAPFVPAPTIITPPAYPNPVSSEPTTNPYPAAATTPTLPSPYPAPGTTGSGNPTIPPSGFEPQEGDTTLKRDDVFLDLPTSQVVVTLGEPVTVEAILTGNLPDPCHSLRVVVTPADANNVISLEVYSIVDTRIACTTVLQPFSSSIPLGIYSNGDYTVTVNGEPLGGFSTVFSPQPADEQLARADVNLDMSLSKLLFLGPQSNEETAYLHGSLPDPCHHLRIVVNPPDPQNLINLDVYSVYDPQTMCIQVIVPFAIDAPLGDNPTGHYTVNVNGQLLGEFDK